MCVFYVGACYRYCLYHSVLVFLSLFVCLSASAVQTQKQNCVCVRAGVRVSVNEHAYTSGANRLSVFK